MYLLQNWIGELIAHQYDSLFHPPHVIGALLKEADSDETLYVLSRHRLP